MSKKFKVGIIGLGNIGYKYDNIKKSNKFYYTHFKSFNSRKNFEISFCLDKNKKEVSRFKKNYSIPCYDNYDYLKKFNYKIDLIVLSTPTSEILKTFMQLIKLIKFKVILIEKPISIKSIHALKIRNICKKNNIQIFVNYNLISDISYKFISNKIQNNNYGKLITGNIYYTKGIYTNASHYINLLIHLFGNYNKVSNINKISKVDNDFSGDFVINFQNVKIYFIYLDEKKYSHYSMNLFFKKGLLSYSNSTREISWQNIKYNNFKNKYTYVDSYKKYIKNNFDKIQLNVVKNLLLYFKNKKYFICDFETSLKTIKCIEKIVK